jgi:hypothetical protein
MKERNWQAEGAAIVAAGGEFIRRSSTPLDCAWLHKWGSVARSLEGPEQSVDRASATDDRAARERLSVA